MALRLSTRQFRDLFHLEPKPGTKTIERRTRQKVASDAATILRQPAIGNMRLYREQQLSADLYARLIALQNAGRLRCVFSAIQNELPIPAYNAELKKTAAMIALKRQIMGVVSGAPDWMFMGPWGGGLIELKTPGGDKTLRTVPRKAGPALRPVKTPAGRLSGAQEAFRNWCEQVGAHHAVCHSVVEAIAQLEAWGAIAPVLVHVSPSE
jgi:hypothetical protein